MENKCQDNIEEIKNVEFEFNNLLYRIFCGLAALTIPFVMFLNYKLQPPEYTKEDQKSAIRFYISQGYTLEEAEYYAIFPPPYDPDPKLIELKNGTISFLLILLYILSLWGFCLNKRECFVIFIIAIYYTIRYMPLIFPMYFILYP